MIHQSPSIALSFVETMLWFFIGILISLFVPLIKSLRTMRKKTGLEAKSEEPPPTFAQRLQAAWQ